MLFHVVKNLEDLKEGPFKVDGFELRLDCFNELNFFTLKETLTLFSFPLIFTLRPERQGGNFKGEETERLLLIEKLFALSPSFFDLEYDIPPSFIKKMAVTYPTVKIILSFHDFQKTPHNLHSLLETLLNPWAHSYKIATFAKSSLDSLRILIFLKENAHLKLTALCMGPLGQITRLIGKVCGSYIDYTTDNAQSKEGQIPLSDLFSLYHYPLLRSDTRLFALIGNPVEKSIGHIFHNAFFKEKNLNSLYVKISLQEEELALFFHYLPHLPFYGLSVTHPFKEKIIPFLDEIEKEAQEIGAVNTISLQNGKNRGKNTDGLGCFFALKKVFNKKIFLLGCGGAAKAIAYTLQKKGALVFLFNRTRQKALDLASSFNVQGGDLEDFKKETIKGYDILINCTPAAFPICPSFLLPSTTFMDIAVQPDENSLTAFAREKGCSIISGKEMFFEQAKLQQKIWFSEEI